MKIQKKKIIRHLDNIILNFTKRTRGKYKQNVTLNSIQGLLSHRFRLGGRNDGDRKELINKPSPAFVVFANAQTQLLPLTKREGIKNHFLTSLPTNLLTFKPAFTLAEVLITLGIIGIVAAMTIPNLITEHKKRTTVTKLQRAISLLNQAYKLSYDEVGEPESAFDLGPEEYFKTYWAPYIKVLTYCSSYSVCGYQKTQPFKTLSNEDDPFYLVTSLGRTTFLTSDGFLYSILTSAGDFKSPQYYVVLDLNGSQEPNTYGKDVFVLKRVPEKGVMPNGYDLSNEEVETGCSINTGVSLYNQYCAEKIRRAGWKIDKDYPWK